NIEKWVNDKGYATTSVVENKVQETANSFSREISNVKEVIKDKVLSNDNLLLGTKDFIPKHFAPASPWQRALVWENEIERYNDFAVKSTIYHFNGLWQDVAVEKGKTYEYGFFVKGSRYTNKIVFSPGWASDNAKRPLAEYNIRNTEFTLTTNWKFHSFRFTVTSSGWSQCRVEKIEENNGIKLSICGLYLREVKNNETSPLGWKPAFEDEQLSINELNTWKQTATETLNTVSSGLNDTVRHSQLRIGADGIDFGSNKVFNGRNLASILSISPESIQAITNKLIITPANENLVKSEYRRNSSFTKDMQISEDFDIGKTTDFLVKGKARTNSYENRFRFAIKIIYKDGTSDFVTGVDSATYINGGMFSVPFKINEREKEIKNAYFTIDRYGTPIFDELSIVPQKSAELIVDGSIEGRQIKAETLETGHHKAGSITSEIIAANAVRAKHILIDDGLINNLVTHNAFISKLWAQDAFIRSLKTVKISTTQLDTDWLSAYTGDIGGFRIGKNPNQPGDFWLTGSNNFNCGLNPGHNIGTRGAQIWAAWGYNWNQAGPNAWWVDGQGRMNCKSSATFYGGLHVYNARLDTHGQDIQGDANSAGAKTTVIWWSQINRVKSSVSDKRFKTNIKPTKVKAVDLLNKIEMVEFNWKKDNKFEKIGAIAQQVQSVEESLVVKDMDSKQSHSDYLRISYYDAIPYLIKAVQELSEENNKLKNKLEEIING
ncbi:tail fiber domain-containing protein, partial [uncultured Gemella sp.]|uniref:tail fiber domain-containing protein n=1 Tax=uncultured Gemella sp. TaxID=254352 RepID=UPI0028D2995A